MLLVKFQQNLNFFRRGGLGNPISIIIRTRMTMGSKIQQNRTMTGKPSFTNLKLSQWYRFEIFFFKFRQIHSIIKSLTFERGGGPNGKFQSRSLLANMKMLRLKFQPNCTLNEEFDLWGIKGGGGRRMPRYKVIGKARYRMVDPFYTESFSTLGQLETV